MNESSRRFGKCYGGVSNHLGSHLMAAFLIIKLIIFSWCLYFHASTVNYADGVGPNHRADPLIIFHYLLH